MFFFFFQAEDGIRDSSVTGVQTCALPICFSLERGARLKLERYDLWRFFAFGAFADDHHDRNELGAFALSRARDATGIDFAGAQIDVIGDTGHDIACGKAFGARTIAVATGPWSREQLAEHEPDFLFDDLANVDKVKS